MSQPDQNSATPAASSDEHTLARWEKRTAQRALEAGHDQLLARSRKIVEAAYELLAESGLEGLTIRAVLNKTGLSRRAFYERFEGKDELVLAVFEQTIRRAAGQFADEVQRQADPIERLRRIVTLIGLGRNVAAEAGIELPAAPLSRRSAALSREHLRLAESRPRELQAALRPLIDLIAKQLAAGMITGQVRQNDPERLAILLYNLVSTTVHSELLLQEGVHPNPSNAQRHQRLIEDLWEFCYRAIST